MNKHLVVVESPAKANTIKKYLGKEYEVVASYGHVRDLLPKKGSVLPDKDFKMIYQSIERNQRHLDTIAKLLKKSDCLYLATDPDREGEAISWHVQEEMKARKLLKDKPVKRIFFNEITKSAIQEAIENPREILMDLVNAQQARRALDYLVGFNLSPLLWKKIRRGLSAGRVQSPALRLIVERELEIEAFKAEEYWKVFAKCASNDQAFKARLTHYQGEKVEQFTFRDEKSASACKDTILAVANNSLKVAKIEKKQRRRNPAAPFITSTLQQEAVRKLGFSARKTMMVAQQLYEGIEVGSNTVGLITYMRTDSVTLSKDAIEEIRAHIEKHYGKDNLPEAPRVYKTKSKNAQEAHEAIRPTSVRRSPTQLKESLSSDQFKLYQLIWKRTIACQMAQALIDTVSADLVTPKGEATFRATGSTIVKPGFLEVYQEGQDDQKKDKEDDDEKRLPPLSEQQVVPLYEVETTQHFTEPPPRYSEATLVKVLEEHDIGRPSTYATIIHTLLQREYVTQQKKRFYPTDIGRIVNRFLTEYFTKYVDYNFTAGLEDELDAIARGEHDWIPVLDNFWQPFNQQILDIEEKVKRKDVTSEPLDEKCPECNHQLSIRLGKRGRFIGCDNYPDCSYTRSLDSADGEPESAPEVVEGRSCPKCRADLLIRTGRYGKFIGCSKYPECNFIEPLEKPSSTEVNCPSCQKGEILKRKSRRGKIFYSCQNYPKCEYALWYEPIDSPCPKCAWPITCKKETKRSGREIICPQKDCSYKLSLDEEKE